MKRLLSVLLIAGFTFGVNAQDKKIRAGLVTGFTVNSTKIQTTNIEKNGTGAGFTIGMNGDFNINENIAIASGIEFNLESFKLNYGTTTTAALGASPSILGDVYYAYDNTDIYKYENGYETIGQDSTAFRLITRKFKSKYVTIPAFLKFQTNAIGSFRYYGKFGLRTSFLVGVRMDDEGFDANYSADNTFNLTASPSRTNSNMKPLPFKKGLTHLRMGIGVYGGADWNFTGNTSLFFEAGFNYGVTPVLYQNSSHLVEADLVDGSNSSYSAVNNLDVKSNPQHSFELKVGLLF